MLLEAHSGPTAVCDGAGFGARRAVRTGEGLKNSPFVATAAAALAAAATAAGVPPEEARRRQ